MDIIEINAKNRTSVGNGPARALRREGRIPAVLYGPGSQPVMLSVDNKELEKILKHGKTGQTLFSMIIDGAKSEKTVMIKELQTEPLSGAFLHADFYEVDLNRKITVSIPVVTVGKAKGVEFGGVLQVIRRELEVICLPMQIPESIHVDISDLGVGDSIHVNDIPLIEGIEIPHDVNFTVITVVAPKAEGPGAGPAAEGAEAEAAQTGE